MGKINFSGPRKTEMYHMGNIYLHFKACLEQSFTPISGKI